MKNTTVLRGVAIIGAACLFGEPASANVVVPVIVAFAGPGMFVALIPIILVESLILSRYGVSTGTSILAVSVANLISTLVGIPIAIVLEIIHGSKLYKNTELTKTFYADILKVIAICSVVFFLTSYWIEVAVEGWFVVSLSSNELNNAVFYGNLVTYVVLFLLVAGWITYEANMSARTVRMSSRKANGKRIASPETYVETYRILAESKEWKKANAAAKQGIEYLRLKEEEIAERSRRIAVSTDVSRSRSSVIGEEVAGTIVPYRARIKASAADAGVREAKKKAAS